MRRAPSSRTPTRRGILGVLAGGSVLGGCFSTAGIQPYREVESFSALKYSVTVRQKFDFSCGGATVATLLTYHLGRETTEVQVLDKLRTRFPGQDWKAIQEKGFSAADLIWVANQFGLEAQAARIAAPDLADLDGPVIVHVNAGTFEHFTVLRTRRYGRTFLSDPVEGAIALSNAEFDAKYTGVALAIWVKGQTPPRNTKLGGPGPWIDGDDINRTPGQMRLPNLVKRII